MAEGGMAGGALQPLAGAQAQATSPGDHVWLSASAGTGKTHVLTARVYRLLLAGVPPENILCLTFTKAGAAEMAERIHNRLALWVQMDGPSLAIDLRALGEDWGQERQDRARRLFAEVLEATGGGLRIQTIHSFCQQLLSAFPVEAGLVPGFRPLEPREQQMMARSALADIVTDAEAQGDMALIAAIQALSLRLGEAAAEAFLIRASRSYDVITALPDDIRTWLFTAFDLPTGDIEADIAAHCADDRFDMAGLDRIVAANRAWGTATADGHLDRIAAWRAADAMGRAALLQDLLGIFCTDKGEPRKASPKLVAAEPGYVEIAARLAERCKELCTLRDRAAYADMLAQALHAGRAYARIYAQAKRHAGAVDFDDLIARAASLLQDSGMADWIRYKLDQQVDHILIDEAQDTNRAQWEIVEAISADFFAGEGARGDTVRTIFTVGDFKQAIFGFQGTSPREFERARQRFGVFADFARHNFHNLSLDRSFRSTPAVLDVVDATVATLRPESLGLESLEIRHFSANEFPGEVLLWKPVSTIAGEEDEGAPASEGEAGGEENWNAEQDRILAQRIADQIRHWIDSETMLESKGRPIRAGDIMILVRSRTELARLIVARLYEADVPVAGIDRLRLNAPLAVRDLLSALRFAVQPEDDLNLAGLLVSPLIGWSQKDLMDRAAGRKGGLWRHLRASVADDVLAPLYDLLRVADFTTPYRYLEGILSGAMDGRCKLIGRLGIEARDPIEELLNAALAFESDGQPSLQRFIDWFDRGDVDIVRDAAAQGNAVRLLTVHGAKGLQAPLVILADAAKDPDAGNRADALSWEGLPVVAPRKSERFGPVGETAEQAASEEREEHWRLLYVAMTRAEERLVVAGALAPRAKGVAAEASWHAQIDRAMADLGAEWEADAMWGAVRRWRGRERLRARPAQPRAQDANDAVEEPAWLRAPAPIEARPPRPLAPSAQPEDDTPDPPPSAAMRQAAERGRLLHALFERLPAIPSAAREGAALRWLERSAGVGDGEVRAAIVRQVLRVIEVPDLAALFSPEALAEAPIAAVVGEAVIAGTVDRLCVGADKVQVVDFKTGRRVPASADQVPLPHLRQMAAYVAALEVIFPGKAVEAALLYTAAPALIVLPPALLAPHKPGFAPAQDNLLL
ncbi:double-strand break repair helicase AddA [Sphingobium aquiterrae]|uniref:double-strand break repair helicase AddA n=1 Tax=Sphingobium aquiterrae TaxID=2038656 RepID=UPI003AFB422A